MTLDGNLTVQGQPGVLKLAAGTNLTLTAGSSLSLMAGMSDSSLTPHNTAPGGTVTLSGTGFVVLNAGATGVSHITADQSGMTDQ